MKLKTKASSPAFSTPGQIIHSPHCSSLHACNWWRKQHGFLWGSPSIMMLRCSSLDSSACRMASFICMKVYGQFRPLLASKTRCQATSTRNARHCWWGCTHMATRPKILLHLAVRLAAIKRKAISFLGFSVLSQAPAWERVVNWACLMVVTSNCWIGGQKSRDPNVVMEVGSHSTVSAHRCEKVLMGIAIYRYSCLQLERRKQVRWW